LVDVALVVIVLLIVRRVLRVWTEGIADAFLKILLLGELDVRVYGEGKLNYDQEGYHNQLNLDESPYLLILLAVEAGFDVVVCGTGELTALLGLEYVGLEVLPQDAKQANPVQ
jgi:hypothetical protein